MPEDRPDSDSPVQSIDSPSSPAGTETPVAPDTQVLTRERSADAPASAEGSSSPGEATVETAAAGAVPSEPLVNPPSDGPAGGSGPGPSGGESSDAAAGAAPSGGEPSNGPDAELSGSPGSAVPDAPAGVPGEAPPGEGPGQQVAGGGERPGRGPSTQRSKRPREPLPWPELRATATLAAGAGDVDQLKELFRLLPSDVREETIAGVREYRKGARRPVSAFAGKSLARAVHTARRGRRRPESDQVVAEALGQALAAEIVASLDVELAAAVILPKRDLLEREAKDARRRQRFDDERSRDERRRAAREESVSGGTFGGDEFTGPKIRGLEQLEGLFGDDTSADGAPKPD